MVRCAPIQKPVLWDQLQQATLIYIECLVLAAIEMQHIFGQSQQHGAQTDSDRNGEIRICRHYINTQTIDLKRFKTGDLSDETHKQIQTSRPRAYNKSDDRLHRF